MSNSETVLARIKAALAKYADATENVTVACTERELQSLEGVISFNNFTGRMRETAQDAGFIFEGARRYRDEVHFVFRPIIL